MASFRKLRTPDVSAGGVNLVVAFGAAAWREVAPWDAPDSLSDFREVVGPDGRRAPATQHDAWMWISGSEPDVMLDHARAAAQAVGEPLSLPRSNRASPTAEAPDSRQQSSTAMA